MSQLTQTFTFQNLKKKQNRPDILTLQDTIMCSLRDQKHQVKLSLTLQNTCHS